jgi:hypothetical protein
VSLFSFLLVIRFIRTVPSQEDCSDHDRSRQDEEPGEGRVFANVSNAPGTITGAAPMTSATIIGHRLRVTISEGGTGAAPRVRSVSEAALSARSGKDVVVVMARGGAII